MSPNPQKSLPIASDRIEALQALVRGFSADELVWTSGFLAGLAANGQQPGVQPKATNRAAAQLTILYGSQTGNGQRLAEALHVAATQASIPSRCVSLADFRLADLKREQAVALVISTHGDGDPPDDAEALYDYLFSDRAPQLSQLSFAVLALGDSSYAQFCETGRELDQRLEELGGTRLIDRVDCDLDFEAPAADWSRIVVEKFPAVLPANDGPPGAVLAAVAGQRYTAEHPLTASVVVNQKITGRDSDKDVRHIEFSIEDSGLTYTPGDSLGVWVDNPPELVNELLDCLQLDGGSPVGAATFESELLANFEITVASRAFVQAYAKAANSSDLDALLHESRRAELSDYLASRQIIDIVREHPAALSPTEFVACLRPLKPRLYSISSAQTQTPDEVSITVRAVRYDAFGRPHWGAGSTYLADRLGDSGEARIYVEPNPRFRLPDDPTKPIIMIGPGTGVAPFRSFLEEREHAGANGKNWLIFGDRTSRDDFLYQLDWRRFAKQGKLDRLDVAFSRDQAEKVYVQDRLREAAFEINQWLEQGAYLYVCGDASQMASDVHAALIDLIASERDIARDAAETALKQLKRDGRYQRDVY